MKKTTVATESRRLYVEFVQSKQPAPARNPSNISRPSRDDTEHKSKPSTMPKNGVLQFFSD